MRSQWFGCLGLLISSIAFGESPISARERLPLDHHWQVMKLEHATLSESIPSNADAWKDHPIQELPLSTQWGEICQGWYRCRFAVPADWTADRTVWLRMENWLAAKVACWVNGQRLSSEYWTGYLPAEWQIDSLLKAGAENEIVLCFWSTGWARVQLKNKAITNDSEAGQEFTFLLTDSTKILPADQLDQLQVGVLVTIICPRDVTGGPLTANGIVIHTASSLSEATDEAEIEETAAEATELPTEAAPTETPEP